MNSTFLSPRIYWFLFSLLGMVYIIGLFVPLMDNDSAHHANIALRMHLTGDYINLIDNGIDYLDKPHLHFWLCALSYKNFGVSTFAYKLPSFLFTLGGVCAVYRLGKSLYDTETGKLAALILASSFSFMLANTDVRMDAILVACIALASWQGVEFVHHKKIMNAAGLGFWLALGFSTKGQIALLVTGAGLFFYMLYNKEWRLFYNWKWLLVLFCFAIFISPVVYCYYQQFNLHPEKIIRGKDQIDGVRFILLNQSAERFGGSMGGDSKKDYLFFIHSFLWAFAPWCIIGFWALGERIKNRFRRKNEWFTSSTVLIMAAVIGLSGFKLPHYLNIVFPVASVMAANWILENSKREKFIYRIQLFIIITTLLLGAVINFWMFPLSNYFIAAGLIVLLAIVFHFIKSGAFSLLQKSVSASAAAMVVFFFLYNSNSSPQLLNYQCGLPLAKQIENKINAKDIYFYPGVYSSSFNFYTGTLRNEFHDSLLVNNKPIYLLFAKNNLEEIKQSGYQLRKICEAVDYEITKPDLKLINPQTRESVLSKIIIAEISRIP